MEFEGIYAKIQKDYDFTQEEVMEHVNWILEHVFGIFLKTDERTSLKIVVNPEHKINTDLLEKAVMI